MMLYRPQISTIIPTYNRATLLKRAVKSALNQSFPYLQVCIYDNNSQDETPEVVAELAKNDSRIKYHRHDKNIGSLNNFNYGLAKVNTPFFSLLSDDDILLPDFYKFAIQGFSQFPSAYLSACDVIEMTESGEFLRSRLSKWPREGYFYPPESLLEVLGKEPVWTGILYRRDVIDEIGNLDPDIGLPSDVDFTIRIASKFPIVISRNAGAIFVEHGSSVSSTTYLNKFWKDWVKIIEKVKNDESLPLEVRLIGERILENQLIGFLFRTRAVINNDFESAYKAANILENKFNQKFKAKLLYLITFLCEKIPLFSKLLIISRTIYRITISRAKSKISHKEITLYRKYLILS